MFSSSHRLFFSIAICVVIQLISTNTLQAQSEPGLGVFKKIGLFDPEDRTRQGLAKNIGKQMRRDLAGTFRFEVVPQPSLSKELPLSSSDLADLGKRLDLDGLITGVVETRGNDIKIDLTLLEAETAALFARESVIIKDWKNPDAVEKGVRTIINKLVGRLPYQAVATEVKDKGKTITIDAGRLNGLSNGMKLQIFRVVKVNRHPFTQETIGVEKVNVGELIVVRADERISVAKPSRLSKGESVGRGQYVVFKPSSKVLSETASRREELLAQQERDWMALAEAALKEKQAKEKQVQEMAAKEKQLAVHKISRGSLELNAGLGWAKFSLNSDQLVFDRKVSTFPLAGVSGEYWLIPSLGLDADYQIGFVKFDRAGSSSINVKARPSWYAFHLQYRYVLWPGTTAMELISRVGYAWYNYRLSETDTQLLTNTQYRGPSIGLEGRLPLTSNLATGIGVDYLPVLKVNENPASSGTDASSHAFRVHAEGRYRITSHLWISVRYLLRDFVANFSGTGSKGGGMTNAKTTDGLSSVMFGLIAEF